MFTCYKVGKILQEILPRVRDLCVEQNKIATTSEGENHRCNLLVTENISVIKLT